MWLIFCFNAIIGQHIHANLVFSFGMTLIPSEARVRPASPASQLTAALRGLKEAWRHWRHNGELGQVDTAGELTGEFAGCCIAIAAAWLVAGPWAVLL